THTQVRADAGLRGETAAWRGRRSCLAESQEQGASRRTGRTGCGRVPQPRGQAWQVGWHQAARTITARAVTSKEPPARGGDQRGGASVRASSEAAIFASYCLRSSSVQ